MRLPNVVVVNLVRRADRRRRLKKELKAYGFTNVTWIEAVDGHVLEPAPPYEVAGMDPAAPWPGWVDPYARRALTMGEVGCALSHVRAWQFVADSGEPAIVLEDDAMPVDGVINGLPLLLNDLSYIDFDLVYLAQCHRPGPKMLAGRHIHVVDYHPLWTLAYLLSAEGAAMLLETPWRTNLCPSDEMLPAAFGLNDKSIVNECFGIAETNLSVLSSNQRFFTPQEGSQTSETEKSVPVNDQSVKLSCFTVASDDTPDLQRLLASGPRYGVTVEVLGLGKKWKGGDMSGPGGGQKVNLLRPALKGLDASQPVLFVDGYDTIITRHIIDMLEVWHDQFDAEPVFAAEVTCWPDAARAEDFPVLEEGNPYRFLNSGIFLAKAEDMRKIIAPKIADSDDDQRYYTDRFLDQENAQMPKIHLDSQCRIFQCLNHAMDDVEVDDGRGIIYNRRCDSWPSVIHANGPTKHWLDGDGKAVGGRWRRYYGDMTTTAKARTAKASIKVPNASERG